ncbi:MAG: quinohemoprotein amine dehydrogenase subunit alpha [Gemmatimonadaceae bacterium]
MPERGSLKILLMGAAAATVVMSPSPVAAQRPATDTTTGFAIADSLVVRRCGGCHRSDSTGHMSRLAYLRKSPEGWEASVRRMASLNNVRLTPGDARAIVKYLANQQGLAPAEIAPGRFEVERRSDDYRYTADSTTERTCRACHSLGRVITQRRSPKEWELLVATHRGYYPNSDFQAFRRMSPAPREGPVPPHPMDQAIAHLSKAFPLHTPEWKAWSATMRPAPLEGSWQLSGSETGRGAFYGTVRIARVAGTYDEFTTRVTYRFARDGGVVTRDGKALVYTGHQWRGRSSQSGSGAVTDSAWREVMSVEPGWQEMSGRWFRGGYDEFGMDVTLRRASPGASIAGVSPRGVRLGSRNAELTIFGANLPRGMSPAAIDFGPGIRATGIVRSSGDELVVRVAVDSAAEIGARDLFLSGASLRGAVVAYRTIDRIRVTPQAGMARVGGVRFPKQFARFEATGYINGADKKPDTADDLDVGPVDVSWGIEEYGVTFKDDDVRYIGTIDQRGVFTPNVDGPNPERRQNRNNIGDVWVVASYKPDPDSRPLKGRAHLIVTVPLYMRWEPTRTSP